MIEQIDRIAIAVNDLAKSTSDYSLFLGLETSWQGRCDQDGVMHTIFDLQNTSIDLCEAEVDIKSEAQMGIMGLVFAETEIASVGRSNPNQQLAEQAPVARTYTSDKGGTFNEYEVDISDPDGRGLGLRLVEAGARLPDGRPDMTRMSNGILPEVDHVVVNTTDPDGAVNLFGESGLNIRLALDQTVEKWGGRMLFFRTGGISIEVVGKLADEPEGRNKDAYWGIAYRTSNIKDTHARLEQQGVAVSEIRKGRKPGTQVATVKSHTLDIPTLIIGPA